MSNRRTRRELLQTAGALAATSALAGCGGTDAGETTPTAANTLNTEQANSRVQEWMANANNFETISDRRSPNRIRYDVNVGGTDANTPLSFDRSAVVVNVNTEIRWVWTGAGGEHTVTSAADSDFEFDSGAPTAEEGHQFGKEFEETGVALYYCESHREQGMKGAIIVRARN